MIRQVNFDFKVTSEKRLIQLNEIDEFCQEAFENARIYKERIKQWHDKHILKREFSPGGMSLLCNKFKTLLLQIF